jgi:hypothetical protein
MSEKLGTDYEKGSDGFWKTLWFCKLTGNVLKEDRLGSVGLPEGGREEAGSERERTDRVGDGNREDT